MSGVRQTLSRMTAQLEESMGVRTSDESLKLVPKISGKDIGRRPLPNVSRIDITQVIPDPLQPRTQFDEDSLQRLAASIRDKGQLSPIRVRWADDIGKWVIISGERRWRACQLAGRTTIDCCIHEGELGSSPILEEQLIENLLREDLNPIEEAIAFQKLIELNGWTGKQLAAALVIPASKVTRTLALLNLPPEIQSRVARGELAARSAYEISRLPNGAVRDGIVQRASSESLTLDDTQQLAIRRRRRKNSDDQPRLTFFVDEGWRVVVSGQRRGCYEEVEQVLLMALEEVRHRIRNQVRWG